MMKPLASPAYTPGMDPEKLRGQLDGELVLPDDDGYDEARVIWNAMHDRRPALIVRPRSTGDVVAALAFAREADCRSRSAAAATAWRATARLRAAW